MKTPILLHVGYHKTATTWMQRWLFTPVHGYRQIAGHQDAFAHVVQPHGFRFCPEPMRNLIAAQLDQLSEGEVPVISSEILSGHPFQGGHESDVYAERLQKIVPDARILISIRAQMRILPSVYMQYLSRGGTMPYERFFRGQTKLGYFGFTPHHFEYDLLVAHYQKLFGKDRVYVMTQESLTQDMRTATRALADFAGNLRFTELTQEAMKVQSPSYPEYAAPILRRINHVQESVLVPTPIIRLGKTPRGLYRLAGYLLRLPPVSSIMSSQRPISRYVQEQFSGHYDDSNRRLAQLGTNPLDLSGYN
jgi:hypothetical protein